MSSTRSTGVNAPELHVSVTVPSDYSETREEEILDEVANEIEQGLLAIAARLDEKYRKFEFKLDIRVK